MANVALLVFHFALLAIALLDPELAKKHRHDAATLDRIIIFVMMGHVRIRFASLLLGSQGLSLPPCKYGQGAAGKQYVPHLVSEATATLIAKDDSASITSCVAQAQWRLLEIEGTGGNWEPVVVNVLGWGTGSMLVWSACLHRLPYNRGVCLSLLQLCVLMLQNGPIVSSMQRHFGDKLNVRTFAHERRELCRRVSRKVADLQDIPYLHQRPCHVSFSGCCEQVGSRLVNNAIRFAVGAWWPEIPGIVYFAIFFCCVRQVHPRSVL